MVQGSIRFVQIERDNSRRRKEKRNDNEIDFERWLFVLFTNGSRFRFNHSERSRVIYLSFDPVAHAREMYVSIGSFPFSRASQKWIRNCLRPGGNKKLRAMIRNRSLPLPLVQTRSTPPHVFSCLVVCLPRYFARRHTGNMRPMERTASVGEADPYARS